MSVYILDTETTGIDMPEIVEAAWIKLNGVQDSVDEYVEFFNPDKQITFGAMSVHNIIKEDLVLCRKSNEFKLPEDAKFIIGHNIDYDWKAIGCPNVKRICTLALSRYLWPEVDSHNQSAMLYFLSNDMDATRQNLKNSHSALCDVKNNHRLLKLIVEKIGSISSWGDLWNISEKARIPTVMTFGKHKGLKISDVPEDYKLWLKKQPELDPYLLIAIS